LLLEPLAHVALVGAGARRQLRRGRRALVGERAVEAELAADVDGGDLERADRRLEEALDKRVGRGRLLGGCGGHRFTSPVCQ
jgi:hypothetical protein